MSLTSLLAEVLFIGHSLIGPVLPGMVERAAAAQGLELRAETQLIPGAPLRWNWDHSAEGQGTDGRRRLDAGGIDHLVLTEALPLANHLEWSDSAGYARQWAQAAWAANPDAQVWIYETWHSLDSGSGRVIDHDALGHVPWQQRIADDWASWQGLAAAAGPQVRVIPAGQAMARLADEIGKGTVPGLTDIREVFSDDIHPNDRGRYLVAMVMHASLTGRDPRGLPARLVRQWQTRAVVTDAMARRMQDIAWEVVQQHKDDVPVLPAAVPAAPPGGPSAPPVPPEDISVKAKQAPEDRAALGGVSAPGIGFGLAGLDDWSAQQPFLDVMKTARPWVGHLPGRWGGWEHADLAAGGWLDAEGWPRAMPPELSGISTLILTDLPEGAGGVAGRYVLSHQGQGTLRVEGRAQVVSQAPGRVVFDYVPGEGTVLLTISATDAADPIRRIRVVREDRVAAADGGALFNPDWLARIRGARLVRFMDWMRTNGSSLSRLEDRPKPGDYTWARNGVPVEVMVALANDLQADPWFTLPHLAQDDLVRFYAQAVHDGLAPGLVAHVEYSNELWNMIFPQSAWAEEQARVRWGQQWKWVQFGAMRAAEVVGIWAQVFADAPDRLVRVLATHTAWKGLEVDILSAPLVVAEGKPEPWKAFDAWAVTAYFSAGIGHPEGEALLRRWLADSLAAAETAAQALPPADRAAHVATHRFDLAIDRAVEDLADGRHGGKVADSVAGLLGDLLPYHARIAQDHGLRLVMYEGGTHVLGMGPLQNDPEVTAFLVALNYSTGMGALYRRLVDGWHGLTDSPFNAFVDVTTPSRWGSWGALRHLGDDNPRWRALARGE
ncbi:hypothetical protein [Gemmobacter sp.]|uniref:hypothetical protein n=1 Tax=Gemmobacter sp. TaxID=1898957 RepID=UPI002AFFBE48|nr:hypothetical protein [Gemmobacter sp.]